ncbi:MAG: hypothetical protein KKB25_02200 [Nanoarchaeota archaeon]|nr:hypothetical protein [Nanoarchaeota archaeon]
MKFGASLWRKIKLRFYDNLHKTDKSGYDENENFRFIKFGKKSRFSGMRPGMKAKTLIVLAIIMAVSVYDFYYFSPREISADFGKEFLLFAGQNAELDGIQIRLEKTITPSCEFGMECKSNGAAITLISVGKTLESIIAGGAEKDFFIVDKKIGIKIIETGQNSAKLIVSLKQ